MLGSSALAQQLVYEKENSELKPGKLRLKTDLVSYPDWAEGLGKYVLLIGSLRDKVTKFTQTQKPASYIYIYI